jgi:hypothetical protein
MARKSEFGVDVTKPGFKPWLGQVTNKVGGAGGAGMAGNVILGGLIGAGKVSLGPRMGFQPTRGTVDFWRLREAPSLGGAGTFPAPENSPPNP